MVLSFGPNTFAQRPTVGTVEFSILGGFSILNYEDPYGREKSETYLSFPIGSSTFPLASMLRMSFWTRSQLVVDLGISLMNISDGGDITSFNFEGGLAAAFGEAQARTFPYAGVLMGVLSISDGNSESEGYLGFQVGFRQFFRKHAAARIQVSLRKFLGDEFDLDTAFDLSGGLSFFI